MSKNKIKIDKSEYGDWVLSLNTIRLEIFSTREYARRFVKKYKNELDNCPKLSSIFDIAADEYLSNSQHTEDKLTQFSCDAIYDVIDEKYSSNPTLLRYCTKYAENFLVSMGLQIYSSNAFQEFPEGPTRQSVRYAWLKFASMIASEEGI